MNPDRFVRFDESPEILVAGLRRHHSISELSLTIPQQWNEFRRLLPVVTTSRGRILGAYCSMSANKLEYLTGQEIASFREAPAGYGRMLIPAQSYAVFHHAGHVAETGVTWERIWNDWLPSSGYEDAETPPFELYERAFDPNTGDGGFEIWMPIRKRRQ